MSALSFAMSVLLGVAMLVSALLAVVTAGRVLAILAAGAVSLFASILFLLLAAPDVAMTEAAIGSGLTTFLFFFVLGRVGGKDNG